MIECKVSDYLTISCLPGDVDCSVDSLTYNVLCALCLDKLFDKFEHVASNFMYERIMRFGDIQVKIPYDYRLETQGVCVEFSGQGLNYYLEYLKLHRNVKSLRFVLKRFIGLSQLGFKTKCSRFDVAFDEIIRKGETDKPYLDLDVIKETLKKGLFVSKFRKCEPAQESGELRSAVFVADPNECDDILPYRFIETMNISTGRIGKTIELGKRKSRTFVRFYDKLAEQEAHGFEVSPDIDNWIRFELEFKQDNATSVMEAYVKLDNDNQFADYIRGVALNTIRFIDEDRSRKYNCTVCDWWYCFLKKAKVAKLVHNKPKFNRYVRALESKKRQQSASFAALIMCDRDNFKSIVLEGLKKDSKTARAIVADFEALSSLSPEEYDRVCQESTKPENGLEFWKRHCHLDTSSDDEFMKFMDTCLSALDAELPEL